LLPDDPLVMDFEKEARKFEATLEGYCYANDIHPIIMFSAFMSLAMRAAMKAGMSRTETQDAIDKWWTIRESKGYRLQSR
jgi:hypothetical protein